MMLQAKAQQGESIRVMNSPLSPPPCKIASSHNGLHYTETANALRGNGHNSRTSGTQHIFDHVAGIVRMRSAYPFMGCVQRVGDKCLLCRHGQKLAVRATSTREAPVII